AGGVEHVGGGSGGVGMEVEGKRETISAGFGGRFAGDKTHAHPNSSGRAGAFYSLLYYPR
ncbi:XRE family transcriptional regulator, partial [Enterobacter roggenkampii]|nr:XRE family transcriptional regulator [Enterobacter roggenkampii]